MCGIAGIYNPEMDKNINLSRFMRDAVICGAVRGQDSTGLYQIANVKAEKYWMEKEAANGNTFLENNGSAEAIVNDTAGNLLTVVHHRAATHGDVNADNAHPFVMERADNGTYFLGVHNGTLDNWNKSEKGNKFNVDSEWAMWKMANDGIKEAIKEFRGAYAFALFDSATPDKFYLAANGQRPLYYAFLNNKKIMAFASEIRMLSWLLNRNSLSVTGNSVFQVSPYSLLTFSAEDPQAYQTYEIPRPVVPAITNADWEYSHRGAWSDYQRRFNNRRVLSTKEQLTELIKTMIDKRAAPPVKENKQRIQAQIPASVVTSGEQDFLTVNLNIPKGTEGLIEVVSFDARTRSAWGEVSLALGDGQYETFSAVIRGVSQSLMKYWEKNPQKVLIGRAIGAFFNDDIEGSPDTVIIMTRPILDDNKVIATKNNDEETKEDTVQAAPAATSSCATS
jgi:hypothetical protein